MATCERCGKCFVPESPEMDRLCNKCVEIIIAEHNQECPANVDEAESDLIINEVMELLKQREQSDVQQLLESPGVGLTLARLTTVSRDDIHMLAMNCFRVGAHLAFKQSKLNKLLNS